MSDRPIRDYALIGNCETAALVNRDGGIDWLCLPAFDGGSIFGALLDRKKGGNFSLHPAAPCEVERSYVEESAVLETRFVTGRGTVVLTDFFVIARTSNARFYDFTSLQPTRKLVRTLRLEGAGPVAMQMRVEARPDYARRQPTWGKMAGGFALTEAALFTSLPVRLEQNDLRAQFELMPNETHFVVLDYSVDERTAPDLAQIAHWQEITEAFWREWNLFNYYRGPHQAVVRRSAVTLKLLTYAPSGAFVAAPTTSLPEVPGGKNNWDYRYTWLRDTGLLIDTLFRLGFSGEAKAFLNFVVRQGSSRKGEEGDPLRLMYAIRGGDVPEESPLDHLGGYGGARPVRAGNRARDQLQLDTFAHVLEAFFYYQHTGGKLDRAMRRVVERSIETLLERWAEPDNGVWETVERRPYTYGKVMAWTGFAAAAKLSKGREKSLGKVCARIRDKVLQKGVRTEDGRRFLAAEYGEGEIDAASLLAFTSGFLEPELGRSTREQIEEKLGAGDLLYRNEEQRENGEGGFLLCSFWLINHLVKEGAVDRAEKILEKLLARMSPLGLFSEEIDPQTGEFLGNFPQAFSHLGLIGTILNLDLAKRKPALAGLSDHEKFERTVGPTVGLRGVLAGFFRVPKTLVLIFRSRSKWQ